MTRNTIKALAAGFLMISAAGCANNQTDNNTTGKASIHVEPSTREAVVGDTVTFISRTQDTYGRRANVKWSSTAGDVKTEDNGRVARVRFNQVGTYTVRATLEVDGREVQSDMVEVRVRSAQ